ncbi:DUF2975 domain-containing protein [Crateriforma conspicua]|uniref:DUF2975 domain-containing protein n=1 Tax=Crateriforma conspicua TaxID=2527996 RepID=A0A5C5Y6G6_9PLAN|nr:DUF2975 domain-containing protein [Crateriforma conspicua]TWT69012.1 hypothetical protein Pan14r_12960 [Crateriforma conspicua]
MSSKPFSLRCLKFVLACWWWLTLLGFATCLLFLIAAPSEKLSFAVLGYASDIDTTAFSVHDRQGRSLDFAFPDGVPVTLQFPASGNGVRAGLVQRAFAAMVIVPCFLVGLFFIKQLRDIMKTVDQDDPFAVANARRIRIIGLLILAFELIVCFGRLAMSGFVDIMARPEGFNFNGRIHLDLELLVVAIAMLVLSEVFRHGTRLRDEQSLTI